MKEQSPLDHLIQKAREEFRMAFFAKVFNETMRVNGAFAGNSWNVTDPAKVDQFIETKLREAYAAGENGKEEYAQEQRRQIFADYAQNERHVVKFIEEKWRQQGFKEALQVVRAIVPKNNNINPEDDSLGRMCDKGFNVLRSKFLSKLDELEQK